MTSTGALNLWLVPIFGLLLFPLSRLLLPSDYRLPSNPWTWCRLHLSWTLCHLSWMVLLLCFLLDTSKYVELPDATPVLGVLGGLFSYYLSTVFDPGPQGRTD